MRMLCVIGPPRPRAEAAATPTRPRAAGVEAHLAAVEDDLLAAFGGSPYDPPALPEGWAAADDLDRLRRTTAERLLDAGGTHLVRTAPTAALFLDFWDAVATVDAVAIVLVPPDDAVHHLVEDEGLEVDAAARLWLRYVVTGWVQAPAREVVTLEALRDEPDAVVRRLAAAGDGGYDVDEIRHALAEAAGGSDRRPAPGETVGRVIGGDDLELARTVHHLMTSPEDPATPVLAALVDGWRAEEAARAESRRAAAATRVAAEQTDLVRRVEERAAALRRRLDESDRRWAGTARAAVVGEGNAERGARHYRKEAERIHREARAALSDLQNRLDRLNRDYDRLRRRRSVRAVLSAAAVARPLFTAVRAIRRRRREAGAAPQETAPAPARVFTVLLNYRHLDDTLRCLEALGASDDRNLFPVVVDNGSGPEAVERLRTEIGARPLIDAGDNLGYAAGNNLGVRHALDRDAEFVWILNPDARVEAGTSRRLLDTMRDNPDCGILGARILNGGSDPVTIASDGGTVDWAAGGATDHVNVGVRDRDRPAGGPHPVDYVPGACMLVRRAVFEDVGLLPEDYFLYFEETDFNLRARDAGWRLLVDPRARVWHHKRSSGRVPAPYYVYYFVRNRLAFTLRHVEGWDPEQAPADLDKWISAWHDKVVAAAPDWLGTFEWLVDAALADARAGVSGRREDIEAVPAADQEARVG